MTTPYDLMQQAKGEHPDDPEVRRARFLSLLRQHGMISRADHPDPAKAVPGVVRQRAMSDQCRYWFDKLTAVATRLDGPDKAAVLGAAMTLDRWAADELADR